MNRIKCLLCSLNWCTYSNYLGRYLGTYWVTTQSRTTSDISHSRGEYSQDISEVGMLGTLVSMAGQPLVAVRSATVFTSPSPAP